MCTVKFSIELTIFQTDDKDITTSNICEKSAQIFKMDDASVHHPPVYVSFLDDPLVSHLPIYVSFLDDSTVRHPPSKVLRVSQLNLILYMNKPFSVETVWVFDTRKDSAPLHIDMPYGKLLLPDGKIRNV